MFVDVFFKMFIGIKDVGERRDRLFYSDLECKLVWLLDKRGKVFFYLLFIICYFLLYSKDFIYLFYLF